jgi:SAM-dependent methyltransferase
LEGLRCSLETKVFYRCQDCFPTLNGGNACVPAPTTNSIQRFSSRVENYVRYRPGYPPEILDLLTAECGLSKHSIIADIGSGTGKLAEIFLRNGNLVFGVEPNSAMRTAAEGILRGNRQFKSIVGSAESTNLPTGSVDFITAGQAFHWFNRQKARREFFRILKPGGWGVIIWNERRLNASPFLRAYEQLLLKFGTDYREVRHENAAGEISRFFAPGNAAVRTFENLQEFDLEGLKGRLLSSSYTPEPGTEASLAMLKALEEVFANYASTGRVTFEYDTRVYYGPLQSPSFTPQAQSAQKA